MNKIVMVPIPVSPEAAEALGDDARRERVGKLLAPVATGHDPLADVIANIKADAARDGLTDAEVEAELIALKKK
jgi:hypothetical protein